MTSTPAAAAASSVDLAIIGSGSGNTLISEFWENKRVVLADGGIFGGTCLNVGCIPTKMFVRPAVLARAPEEAARLGVTMRTEAVDWPGIRDRVFGRIDPISAAGARFRRNEQPHVELIEEYVTLTGPRSFRKADGREVTADQLVIAAGSRSALPDVPGITLPQVHTSETIMRLDELPARVLVLGGGAIANEFASVFSGLGSQVVQVHRRDLLLTHADTEIAEGFTAAAGKRWDLRTRRVVTGIMSAADGGGVVVELGPAAPDGSPATAPHGAVPEHVAVDVVLVATGREPNTDRVDAAAAGLDVHPDGRLAVDAQQRVLAGGAPVQGVFALGDICSPYKLKHVANHEARVVAHNLEHPDDLRTASHAAVPEAIFSDPEVATVGETEAAAVARLGAGRVTTYTQTYGDTAYGWAMEDTEGIFKVVADRSTGQILGAHAMGHEASILIQSAVTAMSFDIDAHTAARGQYWPHPGLVEVVENAFLGLDVPRGERSAR